MYKLFNFSLLVLSMSIIDWHVLFKYYIRNQKRKKKLLVEFNLVTLV